MDSFSTQNIKHHRNIIVLMTFTPLFVMAMVACSFYLTNSRSKSSAQSATGPSVVYSSDGSTVEVNGVAKTLSSDIRYDNGSTPGTITKTANGGVTYTSYTNAERTEQVYATQTNPAWPDNSSGWFAFDFTAHDTDSSWRVIEQEHEGDMSPSRSLEAFEGGSSTQVKICSRYGTPNTAGCAKSWSFNSSVGTRIQIVGYEKFGQGDAQMQAWWRPYGTTTWNQFANSSGFSMGYTSGHPGRYHKRGTYHGNHAEQSSVTWYATALMMPSRSSAEAEISGSSSSPPPAPAPSPPPPAPAPTPTPTPSPNPSPSGTQSPYTSAVAIPGKLEAENYDKGGEGVAYHDGDIANQGGKYRTDGVDIESSSAGYSIGFVSSGEWLEYTASIAKTAKYDVTFRVANGSTTSGSWKLISGNTVLATANVNNTGGWYSWANITLKGVSLTAGTKVLRLEAGGVSVNLDYLTFKSDSVTTPTPPPPPPAPSPTPPPPPLEIPGANSSEPVQLPSDIPEQPDGTIIADFNGDGLNDVVKDSNNDGQIDPSTEIIIDGTDNQGFTDLSQSPQAYQDYLNGAIGTKADDDGTVTVKAGPLSEVKIAKPVAYSFIVAQGLAITGIGSYLILTKLALFVGIRKRLGL